MKKKLFKWVGGKVWVKKRLVAIIENHCEENNQIDTYIEPCAGGLGSFLSVAETLSERGITKVYLNDINSVLISTFEDLYKHNLSLFKEYERIEAYYETRIPKEYRKLTPEMSKEEIKENLASARDYYLLMRREYNEIKDTPSLKRSALFIFLMQHAFNGIYRENGNGDFNTPYNWEPKVYGQFHMRNLFEEYRSLFLRFDVKFSSMDVFSFMDGLKKDKLDWKNIICYIDPPYMNEKNNELKYSAAGFSKENQKDLLLKIKEVGIVNIIYSNHDFDIFRDFALENNLSIRTLERKGKINPLKISKVSELLIFTEYGEKSDT